jgi:hypothetical protein
VNAARVRDMTSFSRCASLGSQFTEGDVLASPAVSTSITLRQSSSKEYNSERN